MGQTQGQATATLELRGKTYTVPANIPIREAIRRAGLSPEAVLPVRDGELIPDDERIRPGETIRLIAVISGGAAAPSP